MNRQPKKRKLLKLLKDHKRISIIIVIAIVLFVIILLSKNTNLWQKETITDIVPFEKSEIVICYSKNTAKLEKKILEVKKSVPVKERANIIFRELKKEKNLPQNTSLYEIVASGDDIIYLNLSKGIMEEKPDPGQEIIMVYSIVNSFLLSFKDSRKVQILIEGRPVYTINGTVYTYKPIEYNKYLLED